MFCDPVYHKPARLPLATHTSPKMNKQKPAQENPLTLATILKPYS